MSPRIARPIDGRLDGHGPDVRGYRMGNSVKEVDDDGEAVELFFRGMGIGRETNVRCGDAFGIVQ